MNSWDDLDEDILGPSDWDQVHDISLCTTLTPSLEKNREWTTTLDDRRSGACQNREKEMHDHMQKIMDRTTRVLMDNQDTRLDGIKLSFGTEHTWRPEMVNIGDYFDQNVTTQAGKKKDSDTIIQMI